MLLREDNFPVAAKCLKSDFIFNQQLFTETGKFILGVMVRGSMKRQVTKKLVLHYTQYKQAWKKFYAILKIKVLMYNNLSKFLPRSDHSQKKKNKKDCGTYRSQKNPI